MAMMPIVFCASLLPWEYAISAAENIWSFEKNLLTNRCLASLSIWYRSFMTKKPITNPITGEVKRGIITLSRIFFQLTVLKLLVTIIVAPTRLPISACEELLGSAMYHVMRFQTIAPQRAAAITYCGSTHVTMPEAMVSATFALMRAPTKLSVADIIVAARGVSTRVETDVAIEFAVSWNPLIKSNTTERRITVTSMPMDIYATILSAHGNSGTL